MRSSKTHKVLASLLALGVSSASLLSIGTASAADRYVATERFTEYANVVEVRPVYQNIRVREPRQECRVESERRVIGYESPRYERHQARRTSERHSTSGVVVGSLIGGVIGNQLARSNSSNTRTGATIAGAIIGGAVVNESRADGSRHRRQEPRRQQQRRQQQRLPIYETVEVERCREVADSRIEQRIQHYDVTYRYKGRTYTTRTQRDPGRRIELQVSIAPARQ